MKSMTTAEFAKANLGALEEAVEVRRYTQVVGTYYPMGYEPVAAPVPPPGLFDGPVGLTEDLAAAEKHVRDLEDEVKRLKQELAKRPTITTTAMPASGHETIRVRADDPFAGLAAQDRAFFERKLGTGKKK